MPCPDWLKLLRVISITRADACCVSAPLSTGSSSALIFKGLGFESCSLRCPNEGELAGLRKFMSARIPDRLGVGRSAGVSVALQRKHDSFSLILASYMSLYNAISHSKGPTSSCQQKMSILDSHLQSANYLTPHKICSFFSPHERMLTFERSF
jgi:hypothetical protein